MSLKLCFKTPNKFPKSPISLSGLNNYFESALHSHWMPRGRSACAENCQQSQLNGELLWLLFLPRVLNRKDAYMSSVVEGNTEEWKLKYLRKKFI